MKKDIFLIGVGNYTEVIIELALDCGYHIKGLYHYNHDRVGETVLGIPIIGCTEDLYLKDINGMQFAVTMGNNAMRNEIASKLRNLGAKTPNLIHPRAFISPSATLGQGCFIHLNAKISTNCTLGNDCVIDFNSLVAHHAVLGDACYMSSLAMVGSYCNLGERVLLGMNSLVIPLKLTIGNDCIIGAKANVTKSFPDNCVLIGNPARKIKETK
ncbi:NeuD/PglB/VioB family sugar acetyltransferase [Xanthomarina sp. F2636L]|uniref:NeuD/PglB/VioB family sugar acetyltransferase n=1 Tax=Xanthomarina sp. F2636L TaxID=2996018 RepID=UPI00225E6223|nr:NeuD/PglB/VioB family sugar acetyltransferase [Xanthomarina sp. F2636L]MCX7549974.1 NeuD/PglB/VioB family sugar acetyltransferase [Xanthomarina sp. F2636L]